MLIPLLTKTLMTKSCWALASARARRKLHVYLGQRRVLVSRPLVDDSKKALKAKQKELKQYLKDCGPKPDFDIEAAFEEDIAAPEPSPKPVTLTPTPP